MSVNDGFELLQSSGIQDQQDGFIISIFYFNSEVV